MSKKCKNAYIEDEVEQNSVISKISHFVTKKKLSPRHAKCFIIGILQQLFTQTHYQYNYRGSNKRID